LGILPLCASRSSVSAAAGQAATLRRSPGRALERSGLCLGDRDELGEVECRLIACGRVAGIAAASI